MYVILYSIDNDCFAVGFIDQIANYRKYGRSPFFFQNSISVFNGKNKVGINLVVGIGHFFLF